MTSADPAAPKLTGEYVVQLPRFKDPKKGKTLVAAQSELLALNDKQFLLIARDSARGFATPEPASVYRSVDLISIAKATNIAGTDFDGTKPVAAGRQARSFGDARRIHALHRHQR